MPLAKTGVIGVSGCKALISKRTSTLGDRNKWAPAEEPVEFRRKCLAEVNASIAKTTNTNQNFSGLDFIEHS
jgi:hypothetical protein